MSVNNAWFPDYGHIVAGIFILTFISPLPCWYYKQVVEKNVPKSGRIPQCVNLFQCSASQAEQYFGVKVT